MTSIPAVVPPLPRQHSWKRNVPRAAAFDWLSAGWRDFTIQPAASVSYGVLVFLVSIVTVVGLFALHLDYILFPGVCRLHGGRTDHWNRALRKKSAHRGRQTR